MAAQNSELVQVLRGLPRPEKLREANEAKVRLSVINKVLEACGWRDEEAHPEHPTGTGDFIDYLLARSPDAPWLVVEAKRASRTFAVESQRGARRSVGALYRQGADVREVLEQAAKYCNTRGASYAAITNGYQWIFFRGLSSGGQPWLKGTALVFASIDEILSRIEEFCVCLHREQAYTARLPELLEYRPDSSAVVGRCPSDMIPAIARPKTVPNAKARAVLDHLFTELYGRDHDGMLDSCYVVPGHASDFDTTLQRLLLDSPEGIVAKDGVVDEARDGTPERFLEELASEARHLTIHHPIAIVGNVGAGKTTFLRRVLVDLIRTKSVITAYVNLEGRSAGGAFGQEDELTFFAGNLLVDMTQRARVLIEGRDDISDKELVQVDPGSRETLMTLFREKVEADWRLAPEHWKSHPEEWERRCLRIFDEARADRLGYLIAFLRHLKARVPPGRFVQGSRKRIPIVVFVDNLDLCTDEYQRFVYGVCAQLTRDAGVISVLSLREDTYRLGRRPGGFLTSSQLQYIFHVAAPPLDRVIRKRLEYAKTLENARSLPDALDEVQSALPMTTAATREVFYSEAAPTEATALVASLSGNDVRESLRFVRAVTQSVVEQGVKARPSVDCVFEGLSAHYGARTGKARPGVFVLFESPPWGVPMHSLPSRVLAYFERAYSHTKKAFLEMSEQAMADLSMWGYPVGAIREVILALLHHGMLRSPGMSEVEAAQAASVPARLVLTASGYAHLTKAVQIEWYRALCGLHMRWYDEAAAKEFAERCNAAGGSAGVTIGDIVASGAVRVLDAYLADCVVKEDALLADVVGRSEWARAVLARASIVPNATADVMRVRRDSAAPVASQKVTGGSALRTSQMEMFGEGVRGPDIGSVEMPAISLEAEYLASRYVARILWALTYAERAALAAPTAADIGAILGRHGGIDVPGSNVARAFRDLGKDGERYWRCSGRRYHLTEAGRLAFVAAFLGTE